MASEEKIYYRHHYWEPPIVIYLFLGGLGGGILFISWVLSAFVFPGIDLTQVLLFPVLISLIAIGIGLIFLVVDLGQPPVFYRAYVTATSIIKWGAVLLTIAAFGSLFWILGNWPASGMLGFLSFFNFFKPLSMFWLGAAGLSGLGIMVYTGVMLSTLKAHSFWATPALPILFTTSALSTACAAITLSVGGFPVTVLTEGELLLGLAIHEILHLVDIILVFVEICILFIMVLSFLGAGNRTAASVARRWVKGSMAPAFWLGMVCIGLVIPQILYLTGGHSFAAMVVAPILVLIGGLVLRYLCVYSDDRQPLPGENAFYKRMQTDDTRIFDNPKWETGA
jgi:polysulfide reductase chain C